MSRSSSGRHKKSSSAKHLRPALPARPASSVPQFPQPTATLPTVPAVPTPKQAQKPYPPRRHARQRQRNCLGELLLAFLLLAGITGGAVALTLFLVRRPAPTTLTPLTSAPIMAVASATPPVATAAATATATSEPIATSTPIQQVNTITILSVSVTPATAHTTQAVWLTMHFSASQPQVVTVAWQFYDSHGRLVAEKTQANIVLSYAHGSYTRASEWTPGAALPPGTYHLTAAVGAAVKQTGAVVTILP